MYTVCPSGDVTQGIDLYQGDPIMDIRQVAYSGIRYAFLKATEGVSFTDKRFALRWASMKKAGLIRGAYHFFHPSSDALTQAKSFCEAVGPLSSDDLPCVMDWETAEGIPSAADVTRGLTFLTYVQQMTQKRPIIYGAPYFLSALQLDQRFANFPLWIAHYGAKCPLVPQPWAKWNFWQYSESGTVPGISGHCDLDCFNGNYEALLTFIHNTRLT